MISFCANSRNHRDRYLVAFKCLRRDTEMAHINGLMNK